jgi:hypothetical protein
MTLGAFRQQVGGMQGEMDTALASLRSGNSAALVSQYSQMTNSYSAVSRELAELYPVRCPRLLGDRVNGDAAMLGAQVDPAAAGLALAALRAGFASLGTDLDQRITQSSPNGLVGNQDEATADTPIASGTPSWDSQHTQDLATRTCAACHSNTPGWNWYTNIAPLSWVVQRNVDTGRAAFNLSEWDVPQPNAVYAAGSVQDGSMPPAWAGVVDSRMQLSDAERAQLVSGLQATFNTVPPPAAASVAASSGPSVLVVLALAGVLLAALALALRPTARTSRNRYQQGGLST